MDIISKFDPDLKFDKFINKIFNNIHVSYSGNFLLRFKILDFNTDFKYEILKIKICNFQSKILHALKTDRMLPILSLKNTQTQRDSAQKSSPWKKKSWHQFKKENYSFVYSHNALSAAATETMSKKGIIRRKKCRIKYRK